jgi:urease gamma subunit
MPPEAKLFAVGTQYLLVQDAFEKVAKMIAELGLEASMQPHSYWKVTVVVIISNF